MARSPASATIVIDTPVNNITDIRTQTITFRYTPIYVYKPQSLPLTLGVTLATATTTNSIPPFQSSFVALSSSSKRDSLTDSSDCELNERDSGDDGIEVEIEKLSKNRRRIRSTVVVDATVERIWGILTDYERLADFIPSLVVSEVLDKRKNFARLLQIGQQKLAFGLKFNAKGVVDCYEKDFVSLPYGERREIEFKMVEGDFDLFEGKWSIEQSTTGTHEQSGSLVGRRYITTLSYMVEVEPKMWLPVQLVEGRISREIKMNLFCIREVAQKI